MPDRFKVTKTDVPEIDTTYNTVIKDDESAVLGKLLPPTGNDDSCEKKGKHIFTYLNIFHRPFKACNWEKLQQQKSKTNEKKPLKPNASHIIAAKVPR